MPSKKPKPCLVVLDVGHGSSAVLQDEGGTVVFDAGKGAHLGRYLAKGGVQRVEFMLLSHADADHIGGAVNLLLDSEMEIEEVFLNADPSKTSDVFEQLRYALAEANELRGTKIDRRLVTSTRINRKGTTIEVLHPTDAVALSGVGGKPKKGAKRSSNSLSAVVRVSRSEKSSILLAGDIEFDCLDGWKSRGITPQATALVFPHHGGLPGNVSEHDAALFAFELTQLVSPSNVIFSNHRVKHGNPRDAIIQAISKASASIQFACTQLPERIKKIANSNGCWALHCADENILEGSIRIEFETNGLSVSFCS